jgi:hypothetical protein
VYLLIDAPDVGPEINFLVMNSRNDMAYILVLFHLLHTCTTNYIKADRNQENTASGGSLYITENHCPKCRARRKSRHRKS